MADEVNLGFSLEVPEDLSGKLEEIDKKINDISKDSELMARQYNDAISNMYGDSELLLRRLKEMDTIVGRLGTTNMGGTQSLANSMSETSTESEQAADSLNRVVEAINSIQGQMLQVPNNDAFEQYKKDSASKIALLEEELKKIRENEKAVIDAARSEERAKRKEAESEEKKAERIRKAQEKETKAQEKLNRTRQDRANTKAVDAYNRAMSSSEATINQRINKIAKLRQAEEMLNKTGKDYSSNVSRIRQEITRLNVQNKEQAKNYERINKSQRKLMDTSGQLMRKLALIFSVSQITNYLRNIREVTGEFEKQNVALASILQNKDKADKLFSQITELAVRSPFQLKELVTYTKQLSAYQIEYEKLYDTTKMLADVSAGLGVDMNRLILAFGQVKAANYLRGTEVRQFTEAGLNILGELAKYYSELEGRMISVGEVQEMVTKRMVAFGDVEEIFKRVTSAGGIFYNMQERQAETLAGMWSNLQDSLDIMMNDIGSANKQGIKDLIASVRRLTENWRDLLFAVKATAVAISPFISYTILAKAASSRLATTLLSITNNGKQTARIMRILNVSTYKLGKGLKMGAVGARMFQTALGGIATIGIGALISGLVAGFVYLTTEMTRASREAKELKKDLDAILSEGEYNAARLSGQFSKLANAVLDSSKSTEEQDAALQELKRTYEDILPSHLLERKALEDLKGNYDSVTTAIYAKIEAQTKEKQITAVSETYGKKVEDSFEDLRGVLIREQKLVPDDASMVINELRKRIDEGRVKIGDDYTKVVEDIIQQNFKLSPKLRESFTSLAGTSVFGKNRFRFVKQFLPNEEVEKYVESVLKLKEAIKDIESLSMPTFEDGEYKALEKNIEEVKERVLKARKEIAAKYEKGGGFLVSEKQIEEERKIWNKWIDDFLEGRLRITSAYGKVVDKDSVTSKKFIEMLQKQMDGLEGNNMQKEVRGVIREFAKLNDISLVRMDKVLMKSSQSMSDYRKSVETYIDDIEDRIKGWEKGQTGFLTQIFDVDDFDAAQQQLSLLKNIKDSLFPDIPDKKQESKALQKLKQQIALIKKAGEEYNKLIKYYKDDEVTDKIEKSFSKAFSDLGLSISMDFDPQGIVDQLEKMLKQVGVDGQKIINQELSPRKAEIGIDVKKQDINKLKEEIDKAFASYQIYVDLEKEGVIDTGFVEELMGIDIFNLDKLKEKMAELKPEAEKGMTEFMKVWENGQKKISEAEDRELKDRLARYMMYLKKSISERASIEIQAQKDLKKLREMNYAPEKEQAIASSIKEERDKKIDKLNFEEFKQSDIYEDLFGDLENVSTLAIQRIKSKLDELKDSMSDLSPEVVKELNNYYEKIEEQLVERNPFSAMRKAMKEVKKLEKNGRDEDFLQQELLTLDADKAITSQHIADMETLIGLKEQGLSLDEMDQDMRVRLGDTINENTESLRGLVSLEKGNLKGIDKKISINKKDLKTYEDARKGLRAVSDEMNNLRNLGKKAFDSIKEIMVSAGEDADSVGMIFADMGFSLVDMVMQAVLFGIQLKVLTKGAMSLSEAMNAAMGPIGWIVMALQAIATIFTAVFQAKDKKKERQIRAELELIEKLQHAYENLEKAVDSAFDSYTLTSGTKKMNESLKEQNEALERSIALEEAKKKTDHERIKEWREDIEENTKKIEENNKKLIASLGGFGTDDNVKSAAEEFASAWLDAYLEVGDGLTGLQDNMNEFLKNAVNKQLLTNLSAQYITPILKEFDKMFTDESVGGVKLLPEEAAAWKDLYESKSEQFNQAAEAYLEALRAAGIDLGASNVDNLSGLQKGIQSVTEDTAEALAAITESIRYFASDSNMQLKSIYNLLMNPPIENPFIGELRLQTEQLRMMYSLVGSFGKTKNGIGGKVLKVEIV